MNLIVFMIENIPELNLKKGIFVDFIRSHMLEEIRYRLMKEIHNVMILCDIVYNNIVYYS